MLKILYLLFDLVAFPSFGHTLSIFAEAILWVRPGQECEKNTIKQDKRFTDKENYKLAKLRLK